jgi:hypothetical protein
MESISLGDITARRETQRARIDYARWLSVVGTTAGQFSAHKTFAAKWPDADLLITKAARQPRDAAATLGVPFASGGTPLELVSAFGQGVRQASVLSRANFVRVPFAADAPAFDLSAIADSAAFVGESGAKPALAVGASIVHLKPGKVAVLTVLSREFLLTMPPGAEQLLDSALTQAITLASDRIALDPTIAADVASGRPASLTHNAAFAVVAPTAADVSAALADLIAMYFASVTPIAPVIVTGPAMLAYLGTSGAYATLPASIFGLPVVTTPAAGQGLYLFDASRTYYADDGARAETSEYATVQMASAPDSPPTAATTLTSMFASNAVCFRVERFVSWQASPSTTGALTVAP